MQYFVSVVQQIGHGISASLLLFVLTLVFSMPLGLLVCFGRMSKFRPLSAVAGFVISVFSVNDEKWPILNVTVPPLEITNVLMQSVG